MSISLDKTYDPHTVQDEIAALWKSHNAFHAEPDTTGETRPYVIVIPPPNVTAALHMGHALNNTIQDVLIRWRRMRGDNAVWIPGTDHAGIATQTVVDKRLQAEGQPALKEHKQLELEGKNGRELFIEKVQAWKDEYEARITEQLVAMGCSCDFDRQRFTMDEMCARAVREAFFELFKAGLIYRGKRLVNWDPVTQTALADDEVENETVDGHFWYMKYPVVDDAGNDTGEFVTVATTRPETMLGDMAVAVNPDDPERAKFIGRNVRLPIVNRVIPVVGDDYVVKPDPESSDEKAKFASGFLKVTPAHDPNDYDIGQRHDLGIINVMAPDASISKDHGWTDWDDTPRDAFCETLLGMDRYEAREAIVTWFREHDLLADVRPYSHSVGHSYRSHVPVEPYLSDQWYVKVTDDRLAGAALDAMTPDQRSDSDGPVWREGGSFDTSQSEPPRAEAGSGAAPAGSTTSDIKGTTNAADAVEASASSRGDTPRLGSGNADGLRFYPARYAKTFQTWHENIRDWCISRQLWWGHRIPVWSYEYGDTIVEMNDNVTSDGEPDYSERMSDEDGLAFETVRNLMREFPDEVFAHDHENINRSRGEVFTLGEQAPDETFDVVVRSDNQEVISRLTTAGFTQDPDVLDTWFSSGLWPISTLGWPNEEGNDVLQTWNPSSTLCTAREIITLWVSRMVMFNRFFRGGKLPFKDVFIHAMIQDGEGQKMSKSLGNGVDPLDIIHSHGADAMRYTLVAMTTQTQDVKMPVDIVCPHCGEAFSPPTIKTDKGHVVAAPIVTCTNKACGKTMTSSFGVASGKAKPTDDAPAARNTSSKFDQGRNFANKIWNAARFVLTNLDAAREQEGELTGETGDRAFMLGMDDRWILSRLGRTIRTIDEALESYRFNDYAQALYDFFWRDFCDWYVEATKLRVSNSDRGGLAARAVLSACLDAALRLMHPAMPFLSEKLFAELSRVIGTAGDAESPNLCIRAKWPTVTDPTTIDAEAEAESRFELLQQAIVEIRNVRNQYEVKPRDGVTVRIKADGPDAETLREGADLIGTLATADVAEIAAGATPGEGAATAVLGKIEIYVEGLIDAGAEADRLTKQLAELKKSRGALQGRLNNKGYVEKAPAHLVEQTREQLAQAERDIDTIEAKLAALQ